MTQPKVRRVGIYVYETTSVAVNQSVDIREMGKSGSTKLAGETKLSKGIYRIDSDDRLVITIGGGGSDVSIMDDKGDWPDPKVGSPRFASAFANTTTIDLQKVGDFFASVERGIK